MEILNVISSSQLSVSGSQTLWIWFSSCLQQFNS